MSTVYTTAAQQREILELAALGYSGRKIAQATDISYGKVRGVLERDAAQRHTTAVRSVGTEEEAEVPPPVKEEGTPSVGTPVPQAGPAVRVVVWDIETTDFKSDIGRLTVSSFYFPDEGRLETRTFRDFEDGERGLAVWTRDMLESVDFIIGHNVKAFDRNFLSGVLARHDAGMIPRRGWWDTYLIGRHGLKGNLGVSMKNLADVFELGDGKYQPSKNDWRDVLVDPDALEEIAKRCEEDVKLNWLIFLKLKPFMHRWLHKHEG